MHHLFYILNNMSTKILNNKTPQEAWYAKTSTQETEGVWLHCTSKNTSWTFKKLDNKSETLVHLGMLTRRKAYQLLDPNIGKRMNK